MKNSHKYTKNTKGLNKFRNQTKAGLMTENELATIAVDICYKIHITLGPGLLETVYEAAFAYELDKR